MKSLITITALLTLLTGCGSKPVDSKPARAELIGEWQSTGLPSGFVRDVGSDAGASSTLSIHDNGSFTARFFPQRSPYRYIDFTGAWELADPSVTPSGSWSIEVQGNHLQCRSEDGQLVLRYTISGKDNYLVEYKKKHKPSD